VIALSTGWDCPAARLNLRYRMALARLNLGYGMALTNRLEISSIGAEIPAFGLDGQVVRMPVPGGTNDRLEIMPGRPTDDPLRQSIVGDQGGRVAIATRPVLNIEIPAHDLLNGRKQLLHGRAMAGSEIQGVAGSVAQKVLDRAGMGIGKIENVDEVAHAGSIACVVVRT
jgi:hypothetical protein